MTPNTKALLASLGLALSISGCRGTKGGVKFQADIFGQEGAIEAWWEALPEEGQQEVRTEACKACTAFGKLRDQFQAAAKGAPDATTKASFEQLAEHYESLVSSCHERIDQLQCEVP